jgi:hypothetical protein
MEKMVQRGWMGWSGILMYLRIDTVEKAIQLQKIVEEK